MLLNADAAQLEWRSCVHLSRDPIGLKEINDGLDFHTENQNRFKLPSRLIAKVFLFRAIFRGSAYAYSVDPNFSYIGGEKFWQGVIDRFYEKYEGIYAYHQRITQEAVDTGKVVVETGRVYNFAPVLRRGEYVWPITDIANYPVQGHAADIMAIVRAALRTALLEDEFLQKNKALWLLVLTVHDSIVFDVDNNREIWYNICIKTKRAFKDAAKNYEALFGVPLLVPMDCDIKVGINWLQMHKLKGLKA